MTEREIFLAAVEKDGPTERAAYLDQACGADAPLRQRVEALLGSHERAPDFMEVPIVEQFGDDGGGLDFLAPSQKPGALGCLAHYEALGVVGRGGMGVVFRAFDTKLHRVVAIKALAPQLATSSAARQRFVREARAAAVTHDNVIAIHGVEDAGQVPYLVMQFIDGPTLQKKLDRTGQLSLKEILRIGLQIAEGLAAAHRQGLVHRDVKPANILLENGVERVKITDFGLARAGDDASLTTSGVVAGTPMYMSPEQADGLPVDFRSDLFSLGSVLYAMCTGRPPFRAASPVAVLKRVCEETPRPITEINPELPPWLGDLVARLHAKAPADRFASAREVADLLARRLAELQHGGTPAAPRQRPAAELPAEKPALAPPGRPRRRWLRAAALLVALLVGLGLSEATGITDVRGTVMRLFAPEDTPAPAQVSADADAWERTVAALPTDGQVKAVAARLKELNPGFDGTVTHKIADDVVTELQFSTDHVTNIAPVRGLSKLRVLNCSGTVPNQGRLADLSPLKGMSLTHLHCTDTRVSDLAPLKEMSLLALFCGRTAVSDLSPLKGMPLTVLHCMSSQVSDLSPLQGVRLRTLFAEGLPVSNVSPLQGMPLTELSLSGTRVSDLAPLKGMPLEYLNLASVPVSDLSPLKDMKTLRRLHLNDMLVVDLSMLKGLPLEYLDIRSTRVSDLAPLKGMPLIYLACGATNVSDLTPLKGMPLRRLVCQCPQVSDLSPLQGMLLDTLDVSGSGVTDLLPLQGMPLTTLDLFGATRLRNLSPLKGLPLEILNLGRTTVTELSPLEDMTALHALTLDSTPVTDLSSLKSLPLKSLRIRGTKVSDLAPLKGMPLKQLWLDYQPERDAKVLRSLKGLEQINDLPAAEFWKAQEK